ncbi:Transmembrane protein 245 [Hondaea fermentalgiana]|uniref:Transmembrane protein 245 n=1 Tax=Hondaea fermentalgiana TaxID=2315210 RepID=A0A2R5G303_9STRA|nr:Transmembrane protein 245 [Hondaea fermentalgiana]|eukprot:GBG25406.1 Transmembrane protein 245 [Hondaea fermentalgiana]
MRMRKSILRKGNDADPANSTVRFRFDQAQDANDAENESGLDNTKQRFALGASNELLSVERHIAAPATDRVSRTNIRKLKKEFQGLASKVEELSDQGTIKAKDKNLRKMIHALSSFVFALLLAGIFYGNYLMLAPHLNAVAMAILLAAVLSRVKDPIVDRLERAQALSQQKSVLAVLTAITLSGALLLLQDVGLPGGGWPITLFGTFGLMVALMDARSLTAALLTIVVICAVCLPLFFALRQCLREVETLTTYLLQLIDDDDALRTLVDSVMTSNVYIAIHAQVTAMFGEGAMPIDLSGTAFKEDIKANIRRGAALVGANLEHFSVNLLNLVTNLSNVMWAFTTFSTTLFYLLSNESPWPFFNKLSPLSPQDNAELFESMKVSTERILLCSTCIGLAHGILMYTILSLSGFGIVAIPSFLCGAMASLPLLGTQVVFVPVAMLLWARNDRGAAILVCAVELLMMFVIDARITAFIPGDRHFVGLSIVAGLYAFGALGFLYGPLLIGLTSSFLEIYLKHLHNPLAEDIFSPAPRRKLFGTPL